MVLNSQYNQSIAEQVIKSDKMGSGVPWRLFTFSASIFLLILLVSFSLNIGYASYLDSSIKDLEQQNIELDKKISSTDQNAFTNFYSRFSNFNNIIGGHIYSTVFFSFLEKITHPYVVYSGFSLNTDSRTLTLSGTAQSFEVLSSQLYLFNGNKMIESYVVNKSQVVNGLVNFDIVLSLSPNVFKKATSQTN